MEKQNKETRVFNADIELREDAEAGSRVIGHAAVFNKLSENLGGFREMIAPNDLSNASNAKSRFAISPPISLLPASVRSSCSISPSLNKPVIRQPVFFARIATHPHSTTMHGHDFDFDKIVPVCIDMNRTRLKYFLNSCI